MDLFDSDRVCGTGSRSGPCVRSSNIKVDKVQPEEAYVGADGLQGMGVGSSCVEGAAVARAPESSRESMELPF